MAATNAGVWLYRTWLPMFLAVPTILLYWIGAPGTDEAGRASTVFIGGVLGLLAWLAIGLGTGSSAVPKAANRSVYDEQSSRQTRIAKSVTVLKPADGAPVRKVDAWELAHDDIARVGEALDEHVPSDGWASQVRYVGVWADIHRAEESLLQLRDSGTVIAGAVMDVQRLTRSEMDGWEYWRSQLEDAIKALREDGEDAEAVATIQTVRRAINEFRDDRGAGLVRLRLDLRRWEAMLGFVVYALFAAAILSIERGEFLVQSFAVYYLVGAGAGLMLEVWRRRTNRPVVEDYGLTRARLRLAPLLSGAAACGGVFLVGLLGDNTLSEIITAEGIEYSDLVLVTNPALAVVAAVFGLAPGRLLRTVQGVGDKLERDLSATEPTGAVDEDD